MAKKVTDTKVLSAVAKHFDKFHESEDFGVVLNNFTSICELLEISPTHYVNFFPDLKVKAGCLVIIFILSVFKFMVIDTGSLIIISQNRLFLFSL